MDRYGNPRIDRSIALTLISSLHSNKVLNRAMNTFKKVGLTFIAVSITAMTGCTSMKLKAANLLVTKPIHTTATQDQLEEASSKIEGIEYTSMETTIAPPKASKTGKPYMDVVAVGHEMKDSPWHGDEQVCAMFTKRMSDPETEGQQDIVGNGYDLNYSIDITGIDGERFTCRGHVDGA
ncbi:hypothetical protein [Vibrio breoganii]|uniref:hypothetical protein n=1 Tax=Vibrio breoganii TaxID=553239 RepID=UPI001F534557|nr:hypothetical protein [Vibrio breoganii]